MTCYWPVHHVTIEYKIVPLRYDMLLASTPCFHPVKIVPLRYNMLEASTWYNFVLDGNLVYWPVTRKTKGVQFSTR